MSIIEFVLSSLTDKSNKQKKFLISPIGRVEANNIEVKININLKNYQRIVDNFGVKHTFKKHGDAKKEASRGQLPIEAEDFVHIYTILTNSDEIIFGELSDMGNMLIKHIKIVDEIKYFYVEEIRRGRKEVALQTFYKRAVKKENPST